MRKIIIFVGIPIAFVLLSLPVLALSDEALSYTIKLANTLAQFREVTFKLILWFIFLTVAAFATYFITNTMILIDNNRRYRYLLRMDDNQKTRELRHQQKVALTNVKFSEKRLVMIGAIIAFFVFLYVVFSAYFYLDPSIVENMWPVIYYCVGVLVIIIILYSVTFAVHKVQYASLPKDEPEAIRIYSKIQLIKQRLKLFVLSIMLLILIYFTLLVVIVRGVKDLSS